MYVSDTSSKYGEYEKSPKCTALLHRRLLVQGLLLHFTVLPGLISEIAFLMLEIAGYTRTYSRKVFSGEH